MFNLSVAMGGKRILTRGTLASREIFIGRSKRCHLVLQDETVSGIHCRLVAIEGGAILVDEGSTNGTFLNGKLVIRPTMMTADDALRAGPYVLRVQSLMGGASPSISPPSRDEDAQRVDPPLSAKARVAEERLRPRERSTELQLSQAQVFWRILGFRQPATLEQAAAAYEAQRRDCRPDLLPELPPRLRALAEQRSRELEFAWEYIQRLFRKTQDAA
jgi:predicted component of type VI protein secretion system